MDEEVTTTSWFTRIKDAFIGILVGIAAIIGSIVLIFWNEGHGLHTAQSLEHARKTVISVPNSPVNEQNNLKVIYISGLASTNEKLTDSLLGISVNAINLDRSVAMYQWGEKAETKTESQMGGSEKHTTTYTYNKTWSNKLIDSSTFKNQDGHVNPSGMLIHSEKQYAKIVTVGEFLLPNTLITRINKSEPVDLSQINQGSLKTEFNMPVSLANKELYFGQNSQTPQIGDLRLNMTAVYPQDVSIIGQQSGKTLQPYLAPAGETVMLLSTGQVSANQMIDDAKSQNKMMTWMFRLVSLILLIIGFSLIMKPVVILADVIPFLGTLVGYGTGFIAFICGLGLWLIVTAIAWFATRPFVSIGILLIVVAGGYWLIKSRKKGSSNTDLTHS